MGKVAKILPMVKDWVSREDRACCQIGLWQISKSPKHAHIFLSGKLALGMDENSGFTPPVQPVYTEMHRCGKDVEGGMR